MPIGVFARRTGLTASALRFSADSGVLTPVEVDPVSGYRYYGAERVARATALRQLRDIAMPLTAVEAVLDAEPGEASRLIDEHVAKVLGDASAVQQKAASKLLALWSAIGVTGDPLHRCTRAHYLADLYEDPAQALAWDIRALDAADAVTEQRVQQHHADLQFAGFYPSPHLNLADTYRRLGSFDAAGEHMIAAKEHAPSLPQDAYGSFLRIALDEVAEAISRRDIAKRVSAPGPAA
ncbi:MerR family transcriptional regulator [Streptomyces sp. NPDC058451]|uniref:MerR family transcriptional regulator n=1 Tax=Streptomyces sp. NPDC058451 TaxID=3346506 RepID=UPI0036583BAC